MNHADNRLTADFMLGNPSEYRSMYLVPIYTKDRISAPRDYLNSAEAMRDDGLLISEISNSGSVGRLKAENALDKQVLLIDGEELLGAKQNRVLNTSALLAANSSVKLPVSCVERGRWRPTSRRMSLSGNFDSVRVRREKVASVSRSLKAGGTYGSSQQEIWNLINTEESVAGAASSTSALSETYRTREPDLQRYVAAFPPQPRQIGAMIAVNGRWAGIEVFAHEDMYACHAGKIVRSHAMAIDPDHAAESTHLTIEHATQELAKLDMAFTEDFSGASVGLGNNVRFSADEWHGALLKQDQRTLHLVAFSKDADSELRTRTGSRTAGRLRRRSQHTSSPRMPARIESNLLLVMHDGMLMVLDTGSPVSMARASQLVIAGEIFPTVPRIGNLGIDELRQLTGKPVDGLLGMDVISCFDVLFDLAHGWVRLRPRCTNSPRGIPLRMNQGIPAVEVTYRGEAKTLFFDTGSRLSYLLRDVDTLERTGERVVDFYPSFGNFDTDVWTGSVQLGDITQLLRFGQLPSEIASLLVSMDVDGILGHQVLERYRVGLSASRGVLELKSHSDWPDWISGGNA